MIIKYFIILLLLMDFVIHIPSLAPLYFKTDSITTTYSGGTLFISDGVTILCCP